MTKLDWLNGLYIRSMQADEIISYIIEYIDKDFFSKFFQWNKEQVFAVIDAYKDRVKTLQELIEKIKLLHDGATEYDKKSVDKWVKKETISHLQDLIKLLEIQTLFSSDTLSSNIKILSKELDIKLVALAQPIRIALVGTSASPGVFGLLEILGKEESLKRLKSLIAHISH